MKANHHYVFYHSIFLRFYSTFDFFNEHHTRFIVGIKM